MTTRERGTLAGLSAGFAEVRVPLFLLDAPLGSLDIRGQL
jgi:hypothetical protein